MGLKTCSKCKKELPATLEYFFKREKAKDKLTSKCKICCGYKYAKPRAIPSDGLKICTVCKAELPKTSEYFHADSGRKDKLNCRCKECDKRRWVKYYSENRQKVLAKALLTSKERHKTYYEGNKEKCLVSQRRRRANNPDLYNSLTQKRLARKRDLPATLTAKQWRQCKDTFNNSCAYCGKPHKRLTQEHFIPISKGGEYGRDNIIPACLSCNPSKSDKDFLEWYPRQPFYSKKREAKILKYLGYKENLQQLSILS